MYLSAGSPQFARTVHIHVRLAHGVEGGVRRLRRVCCRHLDKLWCELERRALKAKVVPRGVGQDEAEVDVDDVTL